MVTGIHHQGHPVYNFKSVTAQTSNLARIIGDQTQTLDAQITKDLGPYAVITQIGGKAEMFIGFNSVQTAILEAVGLEFVHQANPPTLLAQVDHHPFSGLFNQLQGSL